MQPDWSLLYLDRIARATEASAASSRRTRRELEAIGAKVEELIAWVKRIAIALTLWGAAAGMTLNSGQIADLIIALLKR